MAIAINYATAACVGYLFIQQPIKLTSSDIDWIAISSVLGILFSIVFNLCRATTQHVGMSITSVSMKLGVVFPVVIGIVFYKEDFQWINYIGLAFGFTSIVLLNKLDKSIDNKESRYVLFLPFLVWLGSGFCDGAVQLIQKKFPTPASNGMFSFTAFLAAAIASFSFIVWKRIHWNLRSVLGGLALGIPNYFSIYFLVRALQEMEIEYQMESSILFMVNNLAIILTSIAIGMFLFKERLNRYRILGLVSALVSLYLMNVKV